MSKPRRKPANPPVPQFTGDHGPRTLAAVAGTYLEPITDDHGRNPNNQARRRRVNRILEIAMSMRQQQAAMEIQEAYCCVEMLSSGGELKERVDGSPRPDRVIASQVDANSRLVRAMSAVPSAARGIVEHVCWYNMPLGTFAPVNMRAAHSANLKAALDLVANHLRY